MENDREKRLKKEELGKYNENINIQVIRCDTRSLYDQMKIEIVQFEVKISKFKLHDE